MDPINNMISATDPLKDEPFAAVDGEAALRLILSEPAAFSDSMPVGVAQLPDRRLRRARVAGVLVLAAAVSAGVLVAINFGQVTSVTAPAATLTASAAPTAAAPTAGPTPSASPAATVAVSPVPGTTTPASVPPPAAPAWTSFTDGTGQATFEHPAGWTTSEAPQQTDIGAFNTVVVKNRAGKTMAALRLVYDAAGGPVCPEPKPFQTLDSVVLDIPQKASKLKEFPRGPSAFMFRVIESDKVYGSMALSDITLDPGTVTCGLDNTILAPDGVPFAHFGDSLWLEASGRAAALTFDSVAEAKAYMQTQEYQDVKRMLVSLELRPPK
jgi:hypothetical protein